MEQDARIFLTLLVALALIMCFSQCSKPARAQHTLLVPDGASAKEQCEIKCQQRHCDDFTACGKKYNEDLRGACRQRVHDERERCKRSCAVGAIGRER